MLSFDCLPLPSFEQRSITTAGGSYVESFPFATRRQRQRDLLVFEPHPAEENGLSDLCLYRNPHNPNRTAEASGQWEKVRVATLRDPIALAYADISGNGYNDVIIADDYGPSIEKVSPLGGRVSWLENTGSDPGGWVRREIGRFPGINTLKTGRFTNNYSLQILAIPLSLPHNSSYAHVVGAESPSPLVIYTQPPNIVSGRPWLSSIAFSATFRLVSDACVIHPPSNSSGLLDKILLASKEGITLVWWEMERWHSRNIGPGLVRSLSATVVGSGTGLVNMAKVGKDVAGYVVSAESLQGPILSVYTKALATESIDIQHAQWSRFVLDDFSAKSGVIAQIRCVDLDGDGVEEVIALIKVNQASSPQTDVQGVWYYRAVDVTKGRFEKSKIADGDIASMVAGDFQFRSKVDLITTLLNSTSDSSCTQGLTLHSNSFYQPLIGASLGSQSATPNLLVSVPRPGTASAAHELPLFQSFDIAFSLVVLPPRSLFELVHTNDGKRDGVKVLQGRVMWKTSGGKEVSMGRAISQTFCQGGGSGRSMVIEARDAAVTAGAEGAVFLRMRADTRDEKGVGELLKIQNLIPAPYPSHVRGLQFKWVETLAAEGCDHMQVFTLDAFRVRVIDEPNARDLAHVHFTACRGPTSVQVSAELPTLIPAPSPPPGHIDAQASVCQVRACIVNGSGRGGIYAGHPCIHKSNKINPDACQAHGQSESSPPLVWAATSLTEIAPVWCVGAAGEPVRVNGDVLYPPVYGWLSDITALLGGQRNAGGMTRRPGRRSGCKDDFIVPQNERPFDVWMDVDFAPFTLESEENDLVRKTPWLQMLMGCVILVLTLWLYHYHVVFSHDLVVYLC